MGNYGQQCCLKKQLFTTLLLPTPQLSKHLIFLLLILSFLPQRFIPVPKIREGNFHSRSRLQISGMRFPIPVPMQVGNAVCHSQWEFPIPAPKIWELVELFPFQNPKYHSRSSLHRRGCNVGNITDCKINVHTQMFTYKCSQKRLQRWEYHGLQDRAGSIKCGSCCSCRSQDDLFS